MRLALGELAVSGEKPGKEHVLRKLERLADLRAAVDVARMDYEAKRAEILRKVQAELDAVEAEFQPVLEGGEANASALEAEIKNDVLLRGESLHGGVYHAIYMKGRVSWDNQGINDYAQVHPEVLKFRKEGQPSVSLRIAGGQTGRHALKTPEPAQRQVGRSARRDAIHALQGQTLHATGEPDPGSCDEWRTLRYHRNTGGQSMSATADNSSGLLNPAYKVFGADTSLWSLEVDFEKYKAGGATFVIIKALHGVDLDPVLQAQPFRGPERRYHGQFLPMALVARRSCHQRTGPGVRRPAGGISA